MNRNRNKNKKRKNNEPEQGFRRIKMPNQKENEIFAIATKMLGTNKVQSMGSDGVERNCRIPGRMKKRIWIREGDLLIIKPWDFQTNKADVSWRYTNTEKIHLAKKGFLGNLPI